MRKKLIRYAASSGIEGARFSVTLQTATDMAVLHNHIGKCAEHNWRLVPLITKLREVLGRTNCLLSFHTTQRAQKTTPPTTLQCRGNVFTELLHGNDSGIHRETQRLPFHKTGGRTQNDASNNSSIVECIRCRGNVFTEPLSRTDWRDTLNQGGL
jgi:hypothetical protein